MAFLFIPRLKEVRNVDKITYPRLLFDILTTSTTSLVYGIATFKKKR